MEYANYVPAKVNFDCPKATSLIKKCMIPLADESRSSIRDEPYTGASWGAQMYIWIPRSIERWYSTQCRTNISTIRPCWSGSWEGVPIPWNFFAVPTLQMVLYIFKQFCRTKTVDCSGIWTWIVGVEGEHTYHLTTTTAPWCMILIRIFLVNTWPICTLTSLFLNKFAPNESRCHLLQPAWPDWAI